MGLDWTELASARVRLSAPSALWWMDKTWELCEDASGLSRRGRGCGAPAAEVQAPAGPRSRVCRRFSIQQHQCPWVRAVGKEEPLNSKAFFCQGSYFKPSTLWVALLAPKSV